MVAPCLARVAGEGSFAVEAKRARGAFGNPEQREHAAENLLWNSILDDVHVGISIVIEPSVGRDWLRAFAQPAVAEPVKRNAGGAKPATALDEGDERLAARVLFGINQHRA